MNKYLLCVPYGGYNDQISVIYKCYLYCQQVNRTLLVYTNCIDKNDEIDDLIQNTMYTFDLNKYIHFELKNFITDKITIDKILEDIQDNEFLKFMPIYDLKIPKKIQKYFKYDPKDILLQNYSQQCLFYDYPHKLICYYNCGGNYNLDINYLNKFFFKEPIKTMFEERKKLLPNNYIAFHIRNTDYKSEYKNIFEIYKNCLKYPIYLATDSVEVLQYVKSIAQNSVFHFSYLNENNMPLHMTSKHLIDKEQRFIELILDLLCVANSNIFIPSIGGFSYLCNNYFSNKNLIQFY